MSVMKTMMMLLVWFAKKSNKGNLPHKELNGKKNTFFLKKGTFHFKKKLTGMLQVLSQILGLQEEQLTTELFLGSQGRFHRENDT